MNFHRIFNSELVSKYFDTAIAVGTKSISAAIFFMAISLVNEKFGPTILGQFSLLFNFGNVLGIVLTFSISSRLSKLVATKQTARISGWVVCIFCTSAIIFCALLVVQLYLPQGLPFIGQQLEATNNSVYSWLGFYALTILVLVNAILEGLSKPSQAILIRRILPIFTLLCIVSVIGSEAVKHGANLYWFLTVGYAISIIFGIFLCGRFVKDWLDTTEIIFPTKQEVASGASILTASLIVSSFEWMDLVFLQYHYSESDVGEYFLSARTAIFVQFFASAAYSINISKISLAKIADRHRSQQIVIEVYYDTLKNSLIMGCATFCIIALYKVMFVASINLTVVSLLVLGQIFFAPYSILTIGFTLYREIANYAWLIMPLAALVNLLGNNLLTAAFGLTGAALSTMIAFMVSFIFGVYVLRKLQSMGKSHSKL